MPDDVPANNHRPNINLGQILEDSLNEIYAFEADTLRFVLVNRGARLNLGYTMDELVTMTPLDVKPEFTIDTFEQLLRPLRTREKDKIQFETIHRRKDGSHYYVEVHLHLTNGDAAAVFVAMLLDITDRKQGEEALRESQRRLQAVLNTAVEGIITINERGVIDSFNPAAERLFGYPNHEVIGQNVRVLMPEPYRSHHDGYLTRYLETGRKKIIGIGREVIGLRKDGSTFPMALAVSEWHDGGGRMFTGIVRDLSIQRDLERMILEASTHERHLLGRELHDTVAQQLTGAGFLAKDLVNRLSDIPKSEAETAARIAKVIRHALSDLRVILQGLAPVEIDASGLMAALEQLALDIQELFGTRCRFESPGSVALHDNHVATQLYYIAKEAAHNAAKHGHPKLIRIILSREEGQLYLSIIDDGDGIGKGHKQARGTGLRIMRYRATVIGATIGIEPVDPTGTVVTVSLPVENGS